ncbi:xanthine phosphoribosyltransferase [Xylocopilactobacillus apicola]|uniref:Xanthine phosphoribosyltransferase n=1 Tax=Xylocopilactobacillus apicola TaxID=2932184 RepID=A0AAU9DHI8_9LACO|nr:xanthine phosphoribosyltransferase [Xylocopilactobacillus apicola]BDR59475.1 xanthine phosphoribosyltransferase [Xylocopilactobacillus apicola]
MKLLEDRIQKDGLILNDDILKVDSFLNHQVDPALMMEIGKEFARIFADTNADRILTVESSGIAPAVMAGYVMDLPVVFARKHKSLTLPDNVYTADVFSFTKQVKNKIIIDKRFLHPDENILIIDDFLANGQAVYGLLDITKAAGANIQGVGIVIEKTFQRGRKLLDENNIRVEALARISEFKDGKVVFTED